jgi:HD superfamily phosphodiesterase
MYSEIIIEMININRGDRRRINHTLKVFALTKTISEIEISDNKVRNIAIIASILHDIGIKVCEEKYQSSAGKHQEVEGPPIARNILEKLGYGKEIIERVCYLISNHHTYSNIEGLDYRVLVEADLIVNLEEHKNTKKAIVETKEKFFKTPTAIHILDSIFI